MTPELIIIQTGLPDHLRGPAAVIYAQAFQRKLQPIIGAPDIIVEMLREYCRAGNAIVAMQAGRLLGLTGLYHYGTAFVRLPFAAVHQRFGWLRGAIKYGLLALLERPQRAGELLMDGIAVDETLRGQGIGTLLLQGVFDFARAHGYQSVRLDVINTNPGARRLYERMGFVATRTQSVAWLQPFLGFSAVTTMVKNVE